MYLFLTQLSGGDNILPPARKSVKPLVLDSDHDLVEDEEDADEDDTEPAWRSEDNTRAFETDPDDSYVIEPLQQSSRISPNEEKLRMLRALADSCNSESDEAMDYKMDVLFGKDVVPKYQWFCLYGKTQLSGFDVLDLEFYFFESKECGYGNIELHHREGSTWLRIRNAKERHVRFCFREQMHTYRIRKAVDFPRDETKLIAFPEELVSRRRR